MTSLDRRQVLTGAAAGLAGLSLPRPAAALASASARPAGSEPKRLLVLGGTRFLGPAVVDAALARGWEVTLFNRGRSNPHLYPELEKLVGDRDPDKNEGLSALEGDRTWDYVIDTSSYVPTHTRAVCQLLADRVGDYALISTISVYGSNVPVNADESTPVALLPEEQRERSDELTSEDVNRYYGEMKALCEQEAEAALPGRVANIRPGLIVGPDDVTDRFTYWPVRLQRGGDVIAPEPIDDPIQVIDVRDLGEFTVECLANGSRGLFNATGPIQGCTIGQLVHACQAATTTPSTIHWANAERLAELGLRPWMDLPVWTPSVGDSAGMGTINVDRAIAAGLRTRPMGATIADTLAWWNEQSVERRSALRWGLSAEREAQAVERLKQRAGSESADTVDAGSPASDAGER
jgi:2'-hydroxyisoflavone reductase